MYALPSCRRLSNVSCGGCDRQAGVESTKPEDGHLHSDATVTATTTAAASESTTMPPASSKKGKAPEIIEEADIESEDGDG